MATTPKDLSEEQIAVCRQGLRSLSEALREVGTSLEAGMTTAAVNDRIVAALRRHDLEPAMRGFNGYPADANVSVNEQVLHGVPSGRVLRSGDLVKLQTNARASGVFVALGWSFFVGEGPAEARRLVDAAHATLRDAVGMLRLGVRTGDLGHGIQSALEAQGFAVVRDYVGYTLGPDGMQGPQLPCYGRAGTGARFRAGQVLHVHVIAKTGSHEVACEPDGWTVTGKAGESAALFTAVALIPREGAAELLSSLDIPTGLLR